MKNVVNISLLGVLVAIMMIPIVGAHISIKHTGTVGRVAGVSVIDPRDINILPNLKDFNEYVSFAPKRFENGVMHDTLSVTVFQRQKATYRGLYTVYNLTESDEYELNVVTPGLIDGGANFDRIVMWLGNGEEPTVLTRGVSIGAATINVSDTLMFSEGERVLVGEEFAEVIMVTRDSIVVTPLKSDHEKGEIVYPQSIVITPDGLSNPNTETVRLFGGDRYQFHVEVQGVASLISKDQMVTIPLEFRVTKVER